jgi:two-component system sensor histidine kinase VanS
VGHVRYGTAGAKSWEASQPHLSTINSVIIALAHNGTLVNTDELRRQLIELGVPFSDPMADGPVIQKAASEFRPIFAESGLSCSLDLPPKLHYSCDPDKLARVFDNLLRNASYYSLPDSTVEIAGRIEAGKIVLTFSNAGKNIPQEKLDRIFEQFFRLDSSRATRTGGAGLGLAIAKEIVELHGGTIRADSTEDRITFTICLPSDHSEAP